MRETAENPWTARNAPWVTLVGVAAAAFLFFTPPLATLLGYDRLKVAVDGQWWRVFTGNFVHFSGRELGWNVAVLIPAGVWAERVLPGRARLLWLVAPLVVGLVVHGFLPDVAHFVGLTGVATAMVGFLALSQLRSETDDRWFWRVVLALLVVKIAVEAVLASRLMSAVADPSRRAEALIHLAGLAAGAMMVSLRRKR